MDRFNIENPIQRSIDNEVDKVMSSGVAIKTAN
jgi:hypothetical protein